MFLTEIKNSFLRAIKGEEELWKVFWGWGVGGHIFIMSILYLAFKIFSYFNENMFVICVIYILVIFLPLFTTFCLYTYIINRKNNNGKNILSIIGLLISIIAIIVSLPGYFIFMYFLTRKPLIIFYYFLSLFLILIISLIIHNKKIRKQ